ncbi:MAG: PAS domain S-box protein, partial [Chloroflexi bacterium]
VRDRTLPLYREDGALIPDAERPFSLALRAKAPIRGTVVGYGFEPRKWAYVDAVPMFDENGDVDAVMTSSIDITQLKNAEARQRDDAARLRRLIAAQTELGAPDATVEEILQLIADRAIQLTGAPGAAVQLLDGKNVLIAACAGFGSELKDRRFSAKGNPINGCIADGGAESTTDTLLDPRCNQEVARITGIRSLVMAPIRHEGTVIGGLQVQSPDPSPFPDGTQTTVELLAGFAGAAISRVRVARALRDSEQLFSGAFQASGVGMALTTLDGSVIRANSSLCAMLGYTERELAGMSARQLVVPSDLEMAYDTLASLYRRSGPAVVTADLRVACKNGQTVWTRLTASLVTVDTEPRQVLIHLVDVSEERRARSILESEQQRLAVIIEAQREIAGTDVDLDRLLGVLIERTITLTAATAAAVLLPENDELTVRASAGIPEIPLGFRLPIESSLAGLAYRTGQIQQASNAQRDQRAHARTARIKGLGAIVSAPLVTEDGVIGVLQLISEEAGGLDETDARTLQMIGGFAAAAFQRATAARRLRDSEHRNRAVMEAAPESILVLDSNGKIVDFNPAAEHAFLRNRSEVVGESASLLLSPKHVDAFWRWNTAGHFFRTPGWSPHLSVT